jgi:hypothetical protein
MADRGGEYSINFKNLIVIAVSMLLPGGVRCDMGNTISSMILFVIIGVFICAVLGWWSRRQESSK